MKRSPVAPWCTSHQAKLQRILYTGYLLLPAQADKSNTVIYPLRTVIVSDVQGHIAFPAVEQKAGESETVSIKQETTVTDEMTDRLVTLRTRCSANPRRLHLGVVYTLVIADTF